MFRDLLERVRLEASGERAWADVRAVSRHHRIQASPGYDDAAAWVEQSLAGLGLEVERETLAGDGRTRHFGQLMPEGWAVDHARAALVAATGREPLCDFDRDPLSLIQRSAPASGTFRLVLGDDADTSDAEVRGAVVLTELPARAAFERYVRARGAAGLICDFHRPVHPVRPSDDLSDALAYTSFWWGGDQPRGWGLVVTPARGAELRRRLAAGEVLAVEADIATRRFETRIPLVSARLPGESADEILVLSHLCHPKPGAHDNGSGVAAAIESARVVAALSRGGPRPRRGIRWLWMPELTGTFGWLGQRPERVDRLTAALNLDMVGADQAQTGSTFLLEHPPCFAASFAEELLAAIRAEALDWVRSYSGAGHYSMMRLAEVPYSGGSDHAVFADPAIGVPCPMLIHWPDRYYHSSFDTPDRVDPRSLELSVRCAATYALFLAHAGADEVAEIARLVALGARRRLLQAATSADPEHSLARERIRGDRALASLARIGVSADRVRSQRSELAEFAARETGVAESVPVDTPGSHVPRRLKRGPLDPFPELNPGWDALDTSEQTRWRTLDERAPAPRLELAWFAADGQRDVQEIARLVALETGDCAATDIETFFELTTRMGLSAWPSDGG